MFLPNHSFAKFTLATLVILSVSPEYAIGNSLLRTDTTTKNSTYKQITPSGVCEDSDGDGWGWTGKETCAVGNKTGRSTVNATGLLLKRTGDCIDSDGDGWGWNGVDTCVGDTPPEISDSKQNNIEIETLLSTECVDTDGDGWGWDGKSSCKVTEPQPVNHSRRSSPVTEGKINSVGSTVPENCDKFNSGDYHITELVTDVFLSAGQSNATGGQTDYNPGHHASDRVSDRIIVWTENNRWEIADPKTQTWHDGRYPSGRGHYSNHPAFQIARGITDTDSCRVVAFIATAASGMPIDYWLKDVNGHYSSILHKVTTALNALPGKYKIDMIWWMQGEADNDQIVDRYFHKLSDLISRFRTQNWFGVDGYFVANETRIHNYANEAINRLATDGDRYTDSSRGADSSDKRFPSIRPTGVHFNAHSLRQIGDLVADKYLNEYLPRMDR